jgi:NAD(P)-dependent dehydrogenase (short-subunit alcohol dehydrogenase family)
MTASMKGHIALVTGAARRIGRVLAERLASRGVSVVVHYRDSKDEAAAVVAGIREMGGDAWWLQGDLADAATASGLVGRAAETAGGPIDILVNNASIFEQGGLLDTDPETWDRHQAVNLRAPMVLSRALAAQLPAKKKGNIINLNDFRASRPGPDHFAYTISKVGLQGLTRSLALELAPEIRVNELALGAVLAPEGAPEDYVHTLRGEIPAGKFPSPHEVAHAMLFLLENESVTGQTLSIDGGRHLK